MKNVLFLSKGEHSASTRYRAFQFFSSLKQRGYEPAHMQISGGLTNYITALGATRRADLVVVLRRVLPEPLRWLLRRQARILIFDFDDAIFCNSDGSPSSIRMRRFRRMAGMSDHVTAGNAFLATIASEFNDKVTVVPTSVDLTRYTIEGAKPSATFDLVWIGSHSTKKYLENALPSLREASKRVSNLRLKIVADFDLPDAGITTFPIQWSADAETRELGSAHLGIAPMVDNDWTRGKCALKVIQYMASGLPVIASPAGMNGEIVKDGRNGLLVSTPQEWADAIFRYATDPTLRKTHGTSGRETALEYYSIEHAVDKLVHTFERAAADRSQKRVNAARKL